MYKIINDHAVPNLKQSLFEFTFTPMYFARSCKSCNRLRKPKKEFGKAS